MGKNDETTDISDSSSGLIINIERLASLNAGRSETDRTEIIGNGSCIVQWSFIKDEREFRGIGSEPFSRYRDRIPFPKIWPMAHLRFLDVPEEKDRCKGIGKAGLQKFFALARVAGAKCGFLKIGFKDFDEKERNLYFYQSTGWVLMSREPHECYLMYHDLGTTCPD